MARLRVVRSNPFLGNWKIVHMDVWDQDYVDLVVPGCIKFREDGHGEFQFGTVIGWLDYRLSELDGAPLVEFSWQGDSDRDPGCGRGWARLKDGKLIGHIYIHCSDDSAFVAERMGRRA
jgi:hypothetical protein